MGSFNTTCVLTRSVIDSHTEVVMLMLTKQRTYREMPLYAWDLYSPIPIIFEGTYSGYGTLNNIKLFQSIELLNQEELKEVEKFLTEDFKSLILTEKKESLDPNHTLEDILAQREFGFIKPNVSLKIAQTIISHHEKFANEPVMMETVKMMTQAIGFKKIEEVKNYIANNEGNVETTPVAFMMCRKDVFIKLMHEYGVDDNDDEHYAPKVQEARKSLAQGNNSIPKEMMDVMTNIGNYAGANSPAYTYEHAIKGIANKAGKVREDMITLSKLHCVDITLLQEYFSVLGIPFQPTMYVNEDINCFGHKEAFAMQQSLLNSVVLDRKLKL